MAASVDADVVARTRLDRDYVVRDRDTDLLCGRGEQLLKGGPLDEREWQVMRRHTVLGADLLAEISFFADVHPLVRSHHERWEGSGYPDGLRETQIPLGARILAACDAYNAMTTDRPYLAAMMDSDARAVLRRSAGTQFDEAVVDALLRTLA